MRIRSQRGDSKHKQDLLDWLCNPAARDRSLTVVLVAAHPDDEIVGAGMVLSGLPAAWVIHVTDGAPRNMHDASRFGFQTAEEYARARRAEAIAGLAFCGVPERRALAMRFADQEGAFNLAQIAKELGRTFQSIRPWLVVTHAYEGGHPDHDATAFGVHAACRLLASASAIAPTIAEFGSYHARGDDIAVLEFLPNGGEVRTVSLSAEAQIAKRRMIEAHATQRLVIDRFPIDYERFRMAPAYDFTKPPHDGTLHYERYNWGMSGSRFRSLAADALRTLDLEPRI
jgi:LmbE family N-acetylglucosaminyl deacetylase